MKLRAPRGWIIYWIVFWLGAAFLVPELRCAFNDASCTFSWTIWTLMADYWPVRIGVWVLLAWLVWHFSHDFYRWHRKRKHPHIR